MMFFQRFQFEKILFLSVVAFSMFFISNCATSSSKPAAKGKAIVKVQSHADELTELKPTLQTYEDSLLLDLMLGYRQLIMLGQNDKVADAAALKRSHQAYDCLEKILRHGGLSSQDNGERVFTVSNEEKLSFQQVIQTANEAAQKAAVNGDWETAKQRWLEIVQGKSAVQMGLEEATWGLALSEALASNLNEGTKKKLKDLNESYFHAAPYDEISQQVIALLNEVESDKLRRELKKVASRAFDRDKKMGKNSPVNSPSNNGASPSLENKSPEANGLKPDRESLIHQTDSLMAAGKYILALKALDQLDSKKDPAVYQEKKIQIGEHFCEEKRHDAAASFSNYKKSANEDLKSKYLKAAAQHLDSCLFSFGDLTVSQKVRKNREMVEAEIRKLGK